MPVFATGALAQSVKPSTCEYWFDGKFDSRISVQTSGDWTAVLDVAGLPVGVHALNIRVSDSKGRWSSPYSRYFLRTERQLDGNAPVSYEYWIDNDMSTLVSGKITNDNVEINADLSSLYPGVHSLTLRCGDSKGYWSVPVIKYFVRIEPDFSDNVPVSYKYWIDEFKNEAKEAPVGTDGTVNLELDLASLPTGLHSLSMYPVDSRGKSGVPSVKYFVVPEHTLDGNKITAYEYWFNNGPRSRVECEAANPLVITDKEIKIENVVPNEIPSDYTFDVSTGTVWCDDDVHFGLQAFDALGNASSAILSDTFPMKVPVVLAFKALESDVTVTEEAPKAGYINAYRVEGTAGDSIYWTVNDGCTFDLYDAAGNRLNSKKIANDEEGFVTYGMLAPTSVTYALLHHAPVVLTETSVTCFIRNTSGIGNSVLGDGVDVRTSKNTLVVNLPEDTLLNIFNVSGQAVVSGNFDAGEHRYTLSSGVYIIRTGRYGMLKILIP